jgi:predicted Zn-dependent protease
MVEAAAVLERALRIEPRNPLIWQRLARLRLQQDMPRQAESLAAKSNSLAAGDSFLLADNWRLIASAREQQGDRAGAEAARRRAAALLR